MVDGKALVQEYLREVFSEGRLDRLESYLKELKANPLTK